MSVICVFTCDGCDARYLGRGEKAPVELMKEDGTSLLIEGWITVPTGWHPSGEDRYGRGFAVLCSDCYDILP